jgi:hypothetical protein
MFLRTWIARFVVVAAATGVAIAMSAGSANAGLLPVSVTVQPEANNFRWTYSVVLPSNMKLQSGSYFTIYDFAGYQAGTASVSGAGPQDSFAANWTVSTSKLGPTPNFTNPQDDPNITNLTFTYNGPTLPLPPDPSAPIWSGGLGNFSATSLYNDQTHGVPNSFFTATNPRSDGVIDSNITNTIVPVTPGGTGGGPIGTPEPATLALAGLGLPLIGLARYFRRKQTPAPAI